MSALTACGVPFILYFILVFFAAPISQNAGAGPYTVLALYTLGTAFLTYSAYVLKRCQRGLYGGFGIAVFLTATIATFTKVVGGAWPEWDRNTAIIISLVTVLLGGVRSLEDIEAGLPEEAYESWEWFFPKERQDGG